MSRRQLPQLSEGTFITDGGMETTLIFHAGIDLPHFAAFVLLADELGVERFATTSRRTSTSPASRASA